MPTGNKQPPESQAKCAGITGKSCGNSTLMFQQILRSGLDMDMNNHFCILPTEASREKQGTSAQIPLFLSPQSEFHNLAGKLGGNPKFCLVSRQHHVKAEIQKNFDINPWICGVHRKEIFNLQPLRLQKSQTALFRAFKLAIFSTERLTPNYTTLFFKKKHNYL